MEQTQAKPLRRRPLLAMVAVLVTGLCWSLWPVKVDQRFVGKWRCVTKSTAEPGRMDYCNVFELQPDGRTKSFFAQTKSTGWSRSGPMKWRAKEGRFELIPEDTTLQEMLESFTFLFRFGSGRGACFEAEIVAVEPNVIVLREGNGTYEFGRVDE